MHGSWAVAHESNELVSYKLTSCARGGALSIAAAHMTCSSWASPFSKAPQLPACRGEITTLTCSTDLQLQNMRLAEEKEKHYNSN